AIDLRRTVEVGAAFLYPRQPEAVVGVGGAHRDPPLRRRERPILGGVGRQFVKQQGDGRGRLVIEDRVLALDGDRVARLATIGREQGGQEGVQGCTLAVRRGGSRMGPYELVRPRQ